MQLVFVRHGQTALNAGGRLQGRRVDEPLTEVGRAQASAAAQFVLGLGVVSRVVSSPLVRARETAEAVAVVVGVPGVVVDERWTELDYGAYDGRAFADVPLAVWDSWRSDTSFAPPGGGESLAALRDRVWSASDELAASSSSAYDDLVVVVSHVSPIKAAMAWALGVGVEVSWRMFLDVASVCRVAIGARGPSLVAYNERPSLSG